MNNAGWAMVKIGSKWFQPSHIALVEDSGIGSQCRVVLACGYAVVINMAPDEFVVAARMATPGFSKDLPGGRTPAPPSP